MENNRTATHAEAAHNGQPLALFDFLMRLTLVYDTLGQCLSLYQKVIEQGSVQQLRQEAEPVTRDAVYNVIRELQAMLAVDITYPTREEFTRLREETQDADVSGGA